MVFPRNPRCHARGYSHVLRHSYLTYTVGATTDFKTIQGISGHADVFTLLNRYAHSQDEKVLNLSEKMREILTKL